MTVKHVTLKCNVKYVVLKCVPELIGLILLSEEMLAQVNNQK